MIELKAPASTATIKVKDDAVKAYEAQGWTRVVRRKPRKSED